MAKTKQQETEFAFFLCLRQFIEQERKRIYKGIKPLSRKFLEFNDCSKRVEAFLRPPQFEALETYVFLKEFCHNKKVWEIFENWYEKKEEFEGRQILGMDRMGQMSLFGVSELNGNEPTKEAYARLFKSVKDSRQDYSNYIFALTMGLGKTILMGTCICYEFLLANKYPKDENYCHNVIVTAPDKTVLRSLQEIQTFDKSLVIPPDYINWLETNINFHFLDESGTSLNVLDGSKYNVIISNIQKFILKKSKIEKTSVNTLFGPDPNIYKAHSFTNNWAQIAAAAGVDTDEQIDAAVDLLSNQRFSKLLTLPQLGVYIDEAHHVFGTKLSDDLYSSDKASSLRVTVNELALNLESKGSKLVACFNFTGTPYVKSKILPDVVYSYGLKEAIDNKFLKKPYVQKFENIRDETLTFCREVIRDFWENVGQKKFEGMRPKLAFFATTIDELNTVLRPAVTQVLAELNIYEYDEKILVNVGDDKLTSNDDLREFNSLDTPDSKKQFILLCNKGKEGWNCRSLFGVAMHRNPKSTVFVLQATMRCLRQIGSAQQTARIYLSSENYGILDKELTQNFNVNISTIGGNTKPDPNDTHTVEVRMIPPSVKVHLKKIHKLYDLREKNIKDPISFDADRFDLERYKVRVGEVSLMDINAPARNVHDIKVDQPRHYSALSLSADIAIYIGNGLSPIRVRHILEKSEEGIEKILEIVNRHNKTLYDYIIPKFFSYLYDINPYEKKEDIEVELVRQPENPDFYEVSYKSDDLLASVASDRYKAYKDKSFNVDNYCFDSAPEQEMFWALLQNHTLKHVWFTGMLTHGQTDFYINYIDPETHNVRSYYPDFLVEDFSGQFTIIEVKGDNMIDDEVVKAKARYASEIASASMMNYRMIKSSEASKGLSD